MPDQERAGERPQTENTGQPPNLMEQGGAPHEQLVQTFRGLIRDHQAIYQQIHSIHENPHESDVLSSETAVRSVLDWYAESANKEMGDHMFTVRSAWDALSYDRYEPGSREEGLAGSVLQAYYGATREPTIKLTHPMQVRVLDAMAEAADVPHQRGRTEIEIPEKLRNYNQFLMSPEYQARLTQAKVKRMK